MEYNFSIIVFLSKIEKIILLWGNDPGWHSYLKSTVFFSQKLSQSILKRSSVQAISAIEQYS